MVEKTYNALNFNIGITLCGLFVNKVWRKWQKTRKNIWNSSNFHKCGEILREFHG